jgi:hypothetical protein
MRYPFWYRELDDGQRRALAGMMLPVDLTPGQELCVHGEPANCFWMLHEGEVQVGAPATHQAATALYSLYSMSGDYQASHLIAVLCLPWLTCCDHRSLHHTKVQLFDESDTVACISAPAVLGVEALLQQIDAACAARPYGYRQVPGLRGRYWCWS